MNCNICKAELSSDQVHPIHIHKKDYELCGWCAMRVMQYIDGNITHSIINMYWGAGHVCWSTWRFLHGFINEYKITEVLEMGIGLSSELFVAEGLKVIGIDVWKEHVDIYKELLSLKGHAEFHWYKDGNNLPDFNSLYPGRKWDFVFVDGPQERSNEVRLAMKLSSKFIYLHDPNMGERDFFPNDDWVPMFEKESKLFIKKGVKDAL